MSEPGEPQRLPLWKHEEAGNPAPPEGWHNPAPLPPDWNAPQVNTYPSFQDPRVRVAPRQIQPFRGKLKATAALTGGALLFTFSLYLHGYLEPSAFLGGPAQAPGITQAAAPTGPGPSGSGPLIYHTGPEPAGVPAADADGSSPLTDYPTPGHEEASAPLGRPALVTSQSSAYAFMNKGDNGQPVKYDPCRPIHYVTRAANQPSEGPELVREAIAAVSHATGLVFIDDGATTEAPSEKREPYQPARYGDRWAPVLIAWETTAEEPSFTDLEDEDTILGVGGSDAVSIGDTDYTYVSGQLTLNAPGLQSLIEEEGPAHVRGTIEHELGHVVGLDHIKDTTQLMNPSDTVGVTTYQAGDLAGLALLGQGECRPGV
jgi:hypothetical protein